jgi:siderophore-iron reductase FhuF
MQLDMDLTLLEEHFNISTTGSDEAAHAIAASDVMHNADMKEFLHQGSVLLRGIGLELAVSCIGLAYFGLAAAQQYVMSQYNRILDLSLENLTIQLESHANYASVAFKINEWTWTELPAVHRDAAITVAWEQLFSQTLNPLIEATSSAGGLKPSLIWNQYGARMTYMKGFLREQVTGVQTRQRLEDDLMLLTNLPASTFNLNRKNPFEHTPCYIDSPTQTGKQVMLRSSCCMYYRREEGVKCYSCPLLKEDERAERKKVLQAAQREKGA